MHRVSRIFCFCLLFTLNIMFHCDYVKYQGFPVSISKDGLIKSQLNVLKMTTLLCLSASTSHALGSMKQSSYQPSLIPNNTYIEIDMSFEDSVTFIKQYCSEILNATMKTGKLLYRGETSVDKSCKLIKNSLTSDLVETSSYNNNNDGILTASYYNALDSRLKEQGIYPNPSSGHLATSNALVASQYGPVCSIWPTDKLFYSFIKKSDFFYQENWSRIGQKTESKTDMNIYQASVGRSNLQDNNAREATSTQSKSRVKQKFQSSRLKAFDDFDVNKLMSKTKSYQVYENYDKYGPLFWTNRDKLDGFIRDEVIFNRNLESALLSEKELLFTSQHVDFDKNSDEFMDKSYYCEYVAVPLYYEAKLLKLLNINPYSDSLVISTGKSMEIDGKNVKFSRFPVNSRNLL